MGMRLLVLKLLSTTIYTKGGTPFRDPCRLHPVSGLAQGFDSVTVDRRVQPFAQGVLQERMFLKIE